MDELKLKWSQLSLIGKIGLIVALPLLLILLCLKPEQSLSALLDQINRKKVDDKSNELDQQKAQTDQSIAHEEGKIEQIKQDESQAVQNANTQDPVDFINNRFKPPGK